MGLNNFTITKERALPIFILADTSGSMSGEKQSNQRHDHYIEEC